MTSLTVENYLKAIYQLCSHSQQPATTGQLAQALEVSPGSVTAMLKSLHQQGLVHYQPYEGVRLTEQGQREALRVLRRHRLLELFLVQTLGMSWDEVHAEAEHLEHAASDKLIDRIDEFLGHPEFDPHGDPIPKPDGSVHAPQTQRLTECAPGQRVRVARVLDQSQEFLRFVSQCGLTPGREWTVQQRNDLSGVIVLAQGEQQVALSVQAAACVLVTPLG